MKKYDIICNFSESMAAVCKNGKWGFINLFGKEIVHCIYDEVDWFFNGFAAVCSKNKWGFINKYGQEVVSCKYKDILCFTDHLIAVKNEKDKWGFLTELGNISVPFIYDLVFEFSNNTATVIKNGLYGQINTLGNEIVPCIHQSFSYYNYNYEIQY